MNYLDTIAVKLPGRNGGLTRHTKAEHLPLGEVVEWFRKHSDRDGTVTAESRLFLDAFVVCKAADGRGFEWVFSDYSRDRHRQRIDPAGWRLEEYRRNPVVLWDHMWWEPAIGLASAVRVEEGKLRGVVHFDRSGCDPLAALVAEKVERGVLRAGSVGMYPLRVELTPGGVPEDGGEERSTELVVKEQALLEFSIASVPANPVALMTW